MNPPDCYAIAADVSKNSSFIDDITLNTLPAEPQNEDEDEDEEDLLVNTSRNQFLEDAIREGMEDEAYDANVSTVREASEDTQL